MGNKSTKPNTKSRAWTKSDFDKVKKIKASIRIGKIKNLFKI